MILVTGATGDVGSSVLAELANKPVAVRALVRELPLLTPHATNIEFVRGDFSDESVIKRALQGVEAVFLASDVGPKMVEERSKFVVAVKEAHVSRLVHLSRVGANATMCCARALRWLGQAETVAQTSGLEVTQLQSTFPMQDLLQFAPAIAQQGVIAGPFRSGKWTFVDARDVGAVAAATLLDASHAGKTYVVTGAQSLSYADVAECLSRALGKSIRYLDITANESRGRLQATGASPVMIEATLELWDACASKLVNVEPTTVVQDLTGHAPRTFEQFIQDYRQRFG
jgi:uncharacterized protein YbjT (DUF2867 family)